MSESGTYILNEYFILKLIFSYLPSRDLLNASKVCRYWRDIAVRALREHQEPQCCILNDSEVEPPFNEKLLPTIVIDWTTKIHNTRGSRSKVLRNMVQQLDGTYYIKDTSIYNIVSDSYFFSWETHAGSNIGILCRARVKRYDRIHSLMLLGNMPGVEVQCFQGINKHIMKPDGTIANIEEICKSKAAILIVGGHDSCREPTKLLLDAILGGYRSQPNSKMILVGGITDAVRHVDQTVQSLEFLLMTFGDENVTTHGGIHDPDKGITLDEFMRNLSKQAGETPKDCVRLVFAFLCINRVGTYRDINLFKRYFPKVPIYGFYSYGEYYFKNRDEARDERLVRCCFYTNSSSFLVVTLKKSKTPMK